MEYHILIVDDDNRIRDLLTKYLQKNNFAVCEASDTTIAKKIMQKYDFDLLILDYMMPEENGIEFIEYLRYQNIYTPVIMLTALGEIENRIEGLSAGADDYIQKPFEPRELILRINNILKRTNNKKDENTLKFGDFIFDLKKDELYKNNESIKLTTTEIKILKIFCSNINIILSREELCTLCDEINERSIDVQITRLRKKIESEPKNPKFLKTIRHKGYLFNN